MSQVYSTEPQTSGQVVFETTHGPLSIHLWCKECPSTTRYFLQLCVDGYYDNLPFHRIVPNFLIQTGDARYRRPAATSTSSSQSSVDDGDDPYRQPPPERYRERHQSLQAYERRRYELNSRIRFNHRGQVAMALGVEDDGRNGGDGNDDDVPRLQPQFFITLDEAAHLDGRHVCFGGVTGPTVFNALRIGQTDVHDSGGDGDADGAASAFRPRLMDEAPRILRTKVLSADLPPTVPPLVPTPEPPPLPWRAPAADAPGAGAGQGPKRNKKARRGVRNVNLLSFGVDEEETAGEGQEDGGGTGRGTSAKIRSSHDVLASQDGKGGRLVNRVDEELERRLLQPDDDVEAAAPPTTWSKRAPRQEQSSEPNHQPSGAREPFGATATGGKDKSAEEPKARDEGPEARIPQSEETSSGGPLRPSEDRTDATPTSVKPKKVSLVEARRARYASKAATVRPKTKGDRQQREEDTMAKFVAFQQKIIQQQAPLGEASKGRTSVAELEDGENGRADADADGRDGDRRTDGKARRKREKEGRGEEDAKGYHGQVLERDGDEEGNVDWIRTKFKCRRHMDLDAKMGGDGRATDDYVVVEERNSATDRKHDKKKTKHSR